MIIYVAFHGSYFMEEKGIREKSFILQQLHLISYFTFIGDIKNPLQKSIIIILIVYYTYITWYNCIFV